MRFLLAAEIVRFGFARRRLESAQLNAFWKNGRVVLYPL